MEEAIKLKWEVAVSWFKKIGLLQPINAPKGVKSPVGNVILTHNETDITVEWEGGEIMTIPKGKEKDVQ